MVESTINKRKDLESKVFKILFESLESTRKTLLNKIRRNGKIFYIGEKKIIIITKD